MTMYCPRCGSPNTDTTKFCRQCGLPMSPVTGYVASGGTGALAPPPQSPPALTPTDGMTPKQRLVMTILLIVMSPAIFGVLGGITGMGAIFGRLAGLSAVLIPVGVVWAIFRYKSQKDQTYFVQQMHQQTPMPPYYQTPSLPHPQQQPMQPSMSQPTSRTPAYRQPMPSPPPTNPLGSSPSSITEDETRRLPDDR